MCRADKLIVRVVRVASVALCLLWVVSAGGEQAPPQAAAKDGAATPAADAAAPTAAAPAETPTVNATDACESAVKALGAGDLKPFNALPEEFVAAWTQNLAAAGAFTCLAVADGSTKPCDVLPKEAKQRCVEQSKFLLELKGVPKEAMKAQIVEKICLQEGSKADCAKLRQAIASRDAALCAQLSTADGAWGREGLCPALASGDPAKCSVVPEGEKRDTCAAMAADDPKRCPKSGADCVAMVGNFAAIKKGGIEGGGVDPTTAALSQGTKACAPLLADLQKACATAGSPAAK